MIIGLVHMNLTFIWCGAHLSDNGDCHMNPQLFGLIIVMGHRGFLPSGHLPRWLKKKSLLVKVMVWTYLTSSQEKTHQHASKTKTTTTKFIETRSTLNKCTLYKHKIYGNIRSTTLRDLQQNALK